MGWWSLSEEGKKTYGGDAPADIFDLMFDELEEFSEDQVRAAFFDSRGEEYVLNICDRAKRKINAAYQETWARSAYPEELEAMFEFAADFADFNEEEE